MKLIAAAILLSSLIEANRLLQAVKPSTCSTIEYDNPYTVESICCPTDNTCGYPEGYIDQPMAVCADGNQYPTKCHGYCSGQKPESCGLICECQTDTDCAAGYECRETPFGLAGCDKNIGNSCFGFCVSVGDDCGGDIGLNNCGSNEQCFLEQYGNGKGYCGSLQSDCTCIEGEILNNKGKCVIPTCGGIAYCQSFKKDTCNSCGCPDISSGAELCTQAFCGPAWDIKQCVNCIDGYYLNEKGQCDKCDKALCKAAPCDTATCPAIPGAICTDDYCGGCNAIFTDAAGTELTDTDCTIDRNDGCAVIDCLPGDNCYDFSEGSSCCDPSICIEGPKCGNIGDSPCKNGYECINGVCIRKPNSCATTRCSIGAEVCYDTSNGPICCDPNVCIKGPQCGNIGDAPCKPGYECINGVCIRLPVVLPTCALIDCLPGDNCYDFSEGSSCCDPNICIEGPKCGNIGDSPCKNGYECINGLCIRKSNSCGTTTCVSGESCYDTSNGPICCDPNICIQGPKCGNNGDSPCKLGYECINGICIRLPIPTSTCLATTCVSGETCYETEEGAKCCDPNVCEGEFCGGIGNIQCPKRYECVNDPSNPCDPVTTSDCGGICINPDAKQCQFENCALYNDGCNDCGCNEVGILTGCTEKLCDPTILTKPFCIRCSDGYTLNDNNECILQPVTLCPDNCASYNDGCNNCICGDNGLDACTKKLCPPSLEEPKCTKCKPGYRENNGVCDGCVCFALFDPVCCGGKTYSNSCVAGCQQATGPCFAGACPSEADCAALTCPTGSSCCNDGGGAAICCSDPVPSTTEACEHGKVCCQQKKECNKGFNCKKDPDCRANNGSAAGCNKVCVDIDGMCLLDTECDTGYKCILLNGNGVCVKYQ